MWWTDLFSSQNSKKKLKNGGTDFVRKYKIKKIILKKYQFYG